MNIKEQLEQWIEREAKDYHNDGAHYEAIAYKQGANEMKELLLIAIEALKCNETFHRLGGIDDCDPCKALAEIREKIKG